MGAWAPNTTSNTYSAAERLLGHSRHPNEAVLLRVEGQMMSEQCQRRTPCCYAYLYESSAGLVAQSSSSCRTSSEVLLPPPTETTFPCRSTMTTMGKATTP